MAHPTATFHNTRINARRALLLSIFTFTCILVHVNHGCQIMQRDSPRPSSYSLLENPLIQTLSLLDTECMSTESDIRFESTAFEFNAAYDTAIVPVDNQTQVCLNIMYFIPGTVVNHTTGVTPVPVLSERTHCFDAIREWSWNWMPSNPTVRQAYNQITFDDDMLANEVVIGCRNTLYPNNSHIAIFMSVTQFSADIIYFNISVCTNALTMASSYLDFYSNLHTFDMDTYVAATPLWTESSAGLCLLPIIASAVVDCTCDLSSIDPLLYCDDTDDAATMDAHEFSLLNEAMVFQTLTADDCWSGEGPVLNEVVVEFNYRQSDVSSGAGASSTWMNEFEIALFLPLSMDMITNADFDLSGNQAFVLTARIFELFQSAADASLIQRQTLKFDVSSFNLTFGCFENPYYAFGIHCLDCDDNGNLTVAALTACSKSPYVDGRTFTAMDTQTTADRYLMYILKTADDFQRCPRSAGCFDGSSVNNCEDAFFGMDLVSNNYIAQQFQLCADVFDDFQVSIDVQFADGAMDNARVYIAVFALDEFNTQLEGQSFENAAVLSSVSGSLSVATFDCNGVADCVSNSVSVSQTTMLFDISIGVNLLYAMNEYVLVIQYIDQNALSNRITFPACNSLYSYFSGDLFSISTSAMSSTVHPNLKLFFNLVLGQEMLTSSTMFAEEDDTLCTPASVESQMCIDARKCEGAIVPPQKPPLAGAVGSKWIQFFKLRDDCDATASSLYFTEIAIHNMSIYLKPMQVGFPPTMTFEMSLYSVSQSIFANGQFSSFDGNYQFFTAASAVAYMYQAMPLNDDNLYEIVFDFGSVSIDDMFCGPMEGECLFYWNLSVTESSSAMESMEMVGCSGQSLLQTWAAKSFAPDDYTNVNGGQFAMNNNIADFDVAFSIDSTCELVSTLPYCDSEGYFCLPAAECMQGTSPRVTFTQPQIGSNAWAQFFALPDSFTLCGDTGTGGGTEEEKTYPLTYFELYFKVNSDVTTIPRNLAIDFILEIYTVNDDAAVTAYFDNPVSNTFAYGYFDSNSFGVDDTGPYMMQFWFDYPAPVLFSSMCPAGSGCLFFFVFELDDIYTFDGSPVGDLSNIAFEFVTCSGLTDLPTFTQTSGNNILNVDTYMGFTQFDLNYYLHFDCSATVYCESMSDDEMVLSWNLASPVSETLFESYDFELWDIVSQAFMNAAWTFIIDATLNFETFSCMFIDDLSYNTDNAYLSTYQYSVTFQATLLINSDFTEYIQPSSTAVFAAAFLEHLELEFPYYTWFSEGWNEWDVAQYQYTLLSAEFDGDWSANAPSVPITPFPTTSTTGTPSSPTRASEPSSSSTPATTTQSPSVDPVCYGDRAEEFAIIWSITSALSVTDWKEHGTQVSGACATAFWSTFDQLFTDLVARYSNSDNCAQMNAVSYRNLHSGGRRRGLRLRSLLATDTYTTQITATFLLTPLFYELSIAGNEAQFGTEFVTAAQALLKTNYGADWYDNTVSEEDYVFDDAYAVGDEGSGAATNGGGGQKDPVFFGSVMDYAITVVLVLAVVLVICGNINAQCRGADNFKYLAVFLFGLYTWDFFSDTFFAVNVFLNQCQNRPFDAFWVVFIISVVFIVGPLVKNFYDLIQFQGQWQQDPLHADRYRAWLDKYANILFAASFVSGSTFGSIQLMNSNLFGLRVFSMGLSTKDLRRFNQKRLVNVIVGENLPQLIMQVFYSYISKDFELITFLAICSSSLSICAAVLDFASKRKLLNDTDVHESLFSLKIACEQPTFLKHMSRYKHKTQHVAAEIARIFPLDRNAVEILPVEKFSDRKRDGLMLYFFISTSKKQPSEIHQDLEEALKEDNLGESHLARQISRAWGLDYGAKLDRDLLVHCYQLQFLNAQIIAEADTDTNTNTNTNASTKGLSNGNGNGNGNTNGAAQAGAGDGYGGSGGGGGGRGANSHSLLTSASVASPMSTNSEAPLTGNVQQAMRSKNMEMIRLESIKTRLDSNEGGGEGLAQPETGGGGTLGGGVTVGGRPLNLEEHFDNDNQDVDEELEEDEDIQAFAIAAPADAEDEPATDDNDGDGYGNTNDANR